MAPLKTITSPDTLRGVRVPPGQRLTDEWPVLHYGTVPPFDAGTWRLTIHGLVTNERELTYQEFTSLPLVSVCSDVHCVTGWSRIDNLWEGVSTGVVRDLVGIQPGARYVAVHTATGYATNLAIPDFFGLDVLFALKPDGQPLTPEHGYPVRLVVPRLYFWKSAKWVTAIEFMADDTPGFWESRGYHNRGDPWTGERYSS